MAVLQPTTAINPPPYYNKAAADQTGMKYVRLGNTGVVVSRLCLGLMSFSSAPAAGQQQMAPWILSGAPAEAIVEQALSLGINYFDTSELYSDGGSERFFGQALAKLLPASRFTRSDIVVCTKMMPARTHSATSGFGGLQKGLSRKALFDAVEDSLARLGLDYIDLYLIHRFDPNTAPEETMRALHDLVQAGKIRYIGASSMYLWQFAKMQRVAETNGWTKFSVMQNHLNLIYREEEREMIPYCVDSGVALMPYSPLASGVLSRPVGGALESTRAQTDQHGQRFKYHKAGDEAVLAALTALAGERGVPQAQLALAWVLRQRGVAAPVVGATKPAHLVDAVAALQITLTDEEAEKLEAHYVPHAISMHS